MLRAFAGGTLFGEVHGTGAPGVLALPGWMRTRRDFDRVLAGFDAVALDLPGFGGATPPPPTAWGAAGFADAVAPVLDEMGAAPVVLGHSFGGRVAVHLAAAHPDKVGALVLTGVPLLRRAPAGTAKPPLAYRLARALHRRGLVSDARMEARRRRSGSADYRQAEGVMREILVRVVNESYEDQLRAVRCPVELVWGDDDTAAPLDTARAGAALLPDARLRVVPGAGHFTPTSAAAELAEALRRHVTVR